MDWSPVAATNDVEPNAGVLGAAWSTSMSTFTPPLYCRVFGLAWFFTFDARASTVYVVSSSARPPTWMVCENDVTPVAATAHEPPLTL